MLLSIIYYHVILAVVATIIHKKESQSSVKVAVAVAALILVAIIAIAVLVQFNVYANMWCKVHIVQRLRPAAGMCWWVVAIVLYHL